MTDKERLKALCLPYDENGTCYRTCHSNQVVETDDPCFNSGKSLPMLQVFAFIIVLLFIAYCLIVKFSGPASVKK